MPCSSSPGGVLSQHVLQVVSQHALQQVSRGVGISACLAGFQAHTQGRRLGGSVQWGSPGPHPRGKLRGIRSRPTAKGKLRGIQSRPTAKEEVEGMSQGVPAPGGVVWPSVMAFCCGLLLCPSGVVFHYALLVWWPSD